MNGDRWSRPVVRDLAAALHSPWRVLFIDGRSGAGKTSLAQQLAAEHGAQILSLEELYPGWNGLAEGSRAVARVLATGEYVPYDWHAEDFASSSKALVRDLPLIVEGCGAITRANLEAAWVWTDAQTAFESTGEPGVLSVWLELAPDERRRRALERDGEAFAPYWETWAEQERVHFTQHRPWLLASVVHAAHEHTAHGHAAQ